jgi:hypothetical protein
VTTCEKVREHRAAPPRAFSSCPPSAFGQLSGPATPPTSVLRGDDVASIGRRFMRQGSKEGFSLYSQCVRTPRAPHSPIEMRKLGISQRSSRFPFHRRPKWPMMFQFMLLTRHRRLVPALPLEGARQRDDRPVITTLIAANTPEPEGFS